MTGHTKWKSRPNNERTYLEVVQDLEFDPTQIMTKDLSWYALTQVIVKPGSGRHGKDG